jgi:uncharacterized cupredoxin-like copper-binding protein
MHATTRRFVIAVAVACATFAVSLPSQAAPTVIKVSLIDKGGTMEMPMGLGMNMGGVMSKATMSVKLDKTTVPAGEVTFKAVNKSKDMIHEMIVGHLDDPTQQMKYIAADSKVDEEGSDHLGEVSELDPGKSGALTITLKPGTYIIYCNVAGHYMAGMWTLLTVK